MDLDVRNSEKERITRDADLVSEEEKVGVDGEGKEESNSLLSPRGGGIENMQKNSRRKVRWNDRNGNKLAEVWEFQPSDSSDSDGDDGVYHCLCAVM